MILRRMFAVATPLLMVVGIVTACSSVPDITFGEDDGAAPDAPGVDGRTDGSATDGPNRDAPADVVDPDCKPTGKENCEDGIDNDCDGKTDCADTECQPDYQCVDRAPVGFDLVAVSDVRTTACTNGYTDQKDLEMFTSPPACQCTCTDNGGTCTGGTADVTVSDNGGCVGGTTTQRMLNRTQVACAAIPGGNIAVGNNNQRFELATAATKPATCDATVAATGLTPIAGRTCKPPTLPNAGGCAPTQLCVRKPETGYAICTARANGDAGTPASCAAPYTVQRRAGGSVINTPTCDVSECTCNNTNCAGSVTIYETANCGVGKSEQIVSGSTCQAMSVSGGAWTAVAYKATSTGGCTVATNATPQGTLDLTDDQTICCKP